MKSEKLWPTPLSGSAAAVSDDGCAAAAVAAATSTPTSASKAERIFNLWLCMQTQTPANAHPNPQLCICGGDHCTRAGAGCWLQGARVGVAHQWEDALLLPPLGAFAFNTFFQLFGVAKLKLLCLVFCLSFPKGVATRRRKRGAGVWGVGHDEGLGTRM